MADLELRIQRLEDIESIKQLKSEYFHACDEKNIERIRDCFADGEIVIDYGAIGQFTHRDQLIDVFTEMAVAEGVIDAHHGQNPRITWIDEQRATGCWDLYFHQINPQKQLLTRLSGSYQDKYEKLDEMWKITETLFTVSSILVGSYEKEDIRILFAGTAPTV